MKDDKPKLLGDGSDVGYIGDSSTVDDAAKLTMMDRLRQFTDAFRSAISPIDCCTICGEKHHPMYCPQAPKPRPSMLKNLLDGKPIMRSFSRRHNPGKIVGTGHCKSCGSGPDLPCDYWLS